MMDLNHYIILYFSLNMPINWMIYWLVVTGTWLDYFSRNSWEFWNAIIPIDEPLFFRGVGIPPTRWWYDDGISLGYGILILMGKSTISMVIFHSYVNVYQRRVRFLHEIWHIFVRKIPISGRFCRTQLELRWKWSCTGADRWRCCPLPVTFGLWGYLFPRRLGWWKP